MEQDKLARYCNSGLLILRLGIGALFLFHGYPKLIGGPAGWEKLGAAVSYAGIPGGFVFFGFLAACAEFLGALCLILGFCFRPACILMTITMAVAANMHLATGGGLSAASHALEVGFVFLSLVLIGPGGYSIGKTKSCCS